ncbi:MAG: hypothetical protein FWD60_00020 [Candidatus Azobacteroides sp.]|nr:hypothetical protein [Candidatus Azobacteroides sp.]
MKKKFYLMLAAMLVSCMVALGQNPNSNTNNGNGNGNEQSKVEDIFVQAHIDILKMDITLTADQEKEVRKLLGKYYKDREQAAKKADKNQEFNDKKLSHETYIIALYSILTEEQKATIEIKSEERKNQR